MPPAAPVTVLYPFSFGLKDRRFPDLDDFLANWLLMTVGLLLALKVWNREPEISVIFGTIFGVMVAGEFAVALIASLVNFVL